MQEKFEQPILVTRSSMPTFEEYCEEIRPVFESRWLTNAGPKHRELEEKLRGYLGVANVSLFTNGHSALECALEAMELRGEVITTPFTFVSTANAIRRKGLTPVFCDVKPDDLTLDPAKVEALITPRTCAIVPVHVYGRLCDVDAIADIADRYGLKVIYDAAHAFGVRRGDEGAGSFGDASMLSFHATKVFNTVEGGAVCTADAELHVRLSQWRNFGIIGPEDAAFVGGNAKMNEFCAAMGLCNLRHVDDEIARRKTVFERYLERLGGARGLELPRGQEGVRANYAYFPVFVGDGFGESRDVLFDRLAEAGVFARKYFYPLVTDLASYAGFDATATPIARDAAARVITLPMYADLDMQTVDAICDIILAR